MRNDFPHLAKNTVFPSTPDPDVYETGNHFDYHVWEAGTSVKLMNVTWDGATDVVEWADDTARDKWMAGADGVVKTTNELARMAGGQIRLDVPYDVAALYNYMWVEFPGLPVSGEDYDGVRKMGFFIASIEYAAPSTTVFGLNPDTWTTFRHHVSIPSLRLAQGHWAVANSATPADFLADPMAHTENLEDDEGDTVHARKVHDAASALWNTGAQSVVFDCGGLDAKGSWHTGESTTYAPAQPGQGAAMTYADEHAAYQGAERRYYRPLAKTPARETATNGGTFAYPESGEMPEFASGRDTTVNTWGFVDSEYAATREDDFDFKTWALGDDATPVGTHFRGAMPCVFTVANAAGFNPPQGFWQTVRAAYIVPTRFLSFGDAFTFGGVECREVLSTVPEAQDVRLTPEMFGYPESAKAWTKLYTGQYARIVLQSSDGGRMEIPPESVGATASLRTVSQITGDGARIMSYMTGIGADTSEISLERLVDVSFTGGGIWQSMLAQFNVPTYQVFQSPLAAAKWASEVTRNKQRIDARTARDNTLDSGIAARWNTEAAAWQAYANSNADLAHNGTHAVAYQNAVDGARIAYADAIESSDTMKANARDSGEAALKGAEMSRLYAQTDTENANAVTLNTNERNRRKALRDLWTSTRKQLETTGIDLPGVDAITDPDYNAAAYGHTVIGTPGTPTGSDVVDSASVANDMWYLNADTLADIVHAVNESKIQQAVQREGATAAAITTAVNAVAGAPSSYMKGAESAGPTGGAVAAGTGLAGAAVGIVGQQVNLGIQFSGENASTGGAGSENWRYTKSKNTDGLTVHIDTWNGGTKDVDLFGMYGKQYLSEQHTLYRSMLERFYSQTSTTDNNSYAQGLGTTSTRVNTVGTTNGNNLNSQQATNKYVLIDGGTVSSGSTKEITQVPGTGATILDTTGFYGSADPPTLTMKEFDTGGTGITVYGNAERSRLERVDSAKRGALLVTGEDGYKVAAQSKPSTWVQGARNVEVQAVNVGEGTAARNRANANQNSLDNWMRAFYNAQNSFALSTEGNAVFNAWLAELGVEASWRDEQRKPPVAYGTVSGENTMPEVKPQGVWVRVETPVDGDVLRVADRFTQFGYVCHRLVRNPDMLCGRDWCYWRCEKAVVRASRAYSGAGNMIAAILESGVTVWSNPENVGVYSND